MTVFLSKFLKFAMVGMIGMGIDFSITYLCKEKFKLHKYLSNSLGFSFAVCCNYFLNRFWTFGSHKTMDTEFMLFIFVSVAGLCINNGVLWVTHQRFGIPFYPAKLVAIGVTFLWNFLVNYYVTFA